MKCPHCSVTVHIDWQSGPIISDGDGRSWGWKAGHCPACSRVIIFIRQLRSAAPPVRVMATEQRIEPERLVQPRSVSRKPLGEGVPESLNGDYLEACAVLDISPKASAALSRRILQATLQDQGYTARSLADQIDDVLAEADTSKVLPTSLGQNVDVIRKFGNFSAHQVTDRSTSEIIDVEPQEAEWCLELVELLFDHYYIRPAADAARLAGLNQRLQQSGQQPTKS